MSRNIGFTKKEAERIAKMMTDIDFIHIEAYAQKEEHFKSMMGNGDAHTHQWIIVLQKRTYK